MKITEEEQLARKERVIHTAYELFCAQGIEAVSMESIAKQSRVGTASVYRYFNTKAELVLQTAEMMGQKQIDQFMEQMIATPEYQQKSGFEQVEQLLLGGVELYEKYGEYSLFCDDYEMCLIRHNMRLNLDEGVSLMETIPQAFMDALKKGKEDGSISAKRDSGDLGTVIWEIMRAHCAKSVIYDRMCRGENQWKKHQKIVAEMILKALQA